MRDLRAALRRRILEAFLARKVAIIQSAYFGMKGRIKAKKIRNDLMNERLLEARKQVKREFAAVRIQTQWRMFVGKGEAVSRIRARDDRIARAKLEDWASRPIQRIVRGRFGRVKAEVR